MQRPDQAVRAIACLLNANLRGQCTTRLRRRCNSRNIQYKMDLYIFSVVLGAAGMAAMAFLGFYGGHGGAAHGPPPGASHGAAHGHGSARAHPVAHAGNPREGAQGPVHTHAPHIKPDGWKEPQNTT